MKKIFALLLAVLMIAAVMTSCKNNNGDGKTTTTTADSSVTTEAPITETFTEVDETVYVKADKLNVRSTPSTENDTNIVGSLALGEAVKRTGYNEAWSRIIFKDQVRYVASQYVTKNQVEVTTAGETQTDVPSDQFVACDETVYAYPVDDQDKFIADGEINCYSAANRDKWDSTVKAGTEMKRIGKTTEDADGNGWSKLEYNGKTIYARNSVISTKKPETATTSTAN